MNLSTIGIRRILMTTDTIGGVWSYALELCRALGKYRIEVVLAAMGRRATPEQKQAVKQLPNVELRESDLSSSGCNRHGSMCGKPVNGCSALKHRSGRIWFI